MVSHDAYRLYCGDCLEVMPCIPENSVDMVLADLPFGTTQQSWDKVIDMPSLWDEYMRIVKPNGAIVLFAKPPFDKVLACSNLKYYRYDWIWEKTRATGHLNSKRMPLQAHENICVFYRRAPVYNPQMTQGHKPVNKFYTRRAGSCYGAEGRVSSGGGNTDRYPRSVLKYPPVPNSRRIHTNEKPVELVSELIRTYTNIGDVVLDNTMGSAAVGEGCLLSGRYFIGIEKDKNMFGKASGRLSAVVDANAC